jgi:hypothetical protein
MCTAILLQATNRCVQLIDLALLANNMLKGEALANFVTTQCGYDVKHIFTKEKPVE